MINVALFGNPNVGKTTVFNLLTGSNQYVGNWPGVTIDKKEGFLGKDIKIVDLPGIYAMDTFSNEEKVSKEFLETGDVDVIDVYKRQSINFVPASDILPSLLTNKNGLAIEYVSFFTFSAVNSTPSIVNAFTLSST